MRRYRWLVFVLALVAARAVPASAGWIDYPKANLAVCTATADQTIPQVVSDGSGGAIVAWVDYRSATSSDIYAQHVLASGAVDPGWPANGLALCSAPNTQYAPMLVSDGAGGAIVAWRDYRSGTSYDVYAQRVNAVGVVQWASDGVALCTAVHDQLTPTLPTNGAGGVIVSDGAGGAIVAWEDYRNGVNSFIYAQRVNAVGAPHWTPDGVAICTTPSGHHQSPATVSDGAGGAIITWHDSRSTTNWDIYAQRVNAFGMPQWTTDGVAICTAANDQRYPSIVSDGGAGAIVSWGDNRGLTWDIYAQHVLATGAVDPAWPANGRALCAAGGDQYYPVTVGDGSGGAIVTWMDQRIGSWDVYAQHVLASGGVDLAWPVDGRALCVAGGDQFTNSTAPDGAGGAIATWWDRRDGPDHIYAQHVLSSGSIAYGWPVNGLALCTAAASQINPAIAADGAGGAIVAWQDYRGGGADIYAQRVTFTGSLGNISVAPAIAGARDIPNDQGGKLKLMWSASLLDVDPYNAIADYRIWRSVPPAFIQSALASGARLVAPGEAPALEPGQSFRATRSASGIIYWEYYGTEVARQFSGYSMVVNTTSDSVVGSNPYTLFMVEARHVNGGEHFDSAPDSGYSVDNLAPPTPMPFVAQYGPSQTALHWVPNPAPDFQAFRLYRGTSTVFLPGASNLIFGGRDTGYVDATGGSGFYKLAAVDIHGNLSHYALVSPDGATSTLASLSSVEAAADRISLTWFTGGNPGLVATVYRRTADSDWATLGEVLADGGGYLRYIDESVAAGTRYGYQLGIWDGGMEVFAGQAWVTADSPVLALEGVRPNPSHGAPIRVQFVLSASGPAQLELLDVGGRRLASRDVGSLGPGRHVVDLAEGPPLPPGIYLVRFAAAGRTMTTRAAVLR